MKDLFKKKSKKTTTREELAEIVAECPETMDNCIMFVMHDRGMSFKMKTQDKKTAMALFITALAKEEQLRILATSAIKLLVEYASEELNTK